MLAGAARPFCVDCMRFPLRSTRGRLQLLPPRHHTFELGLDLRQSFLRIHDRAAVAQERRLGKRLVDALPLPLRLLDSLRQRRQLRGLLECQLPVSSYAWSLLRRLALRRRWLLGHLPLSHPIGIAADIL